MNILTTDNLKNDLIEKLNTANIKNQILLLSRSITEEEKFYKNSIIKRCEEFAIPYVEKDFSEDADKDEILSFISSYDKGDGFIIFLPFGRYEKINELKEDIKINDLDGFTYRSQGKAANGSFKDLPATPKAVARFIESKGYIEGKYIVIANNTNLIGLPLASYLSSKGATVTIINEFTTDAHNHIKNSDIFISAIGQANFYDNSYFKDGQLLIDVGTSEVNGKIVGDIDYDLLEEIDVDVLTNKKGIGAITTLSLLEGLID